MGDKEKRANLENLERGDVIRYDNKYFIVSVSGSVNDQVYGHALSPTGDHAISIDELVKKNKVEIAEWFKLR